MSDSLTTVCEDLLQLRDEVAQSEFRPSADDICNRLTALAKRIEACDTRPNSGGASGSHMHGNTYYRTPGTQPEGIGLSRDDTSGTEPEQSISPAAETPRTEVADATVHTGDEQSAKPKTVRARKSR